ncbi:MAG: hypothetical protein EBR48_02615 [bacterium]|nr:hypothetical protein [Candidatus Aquidulcis frankliniae]
MDLSIVVFDLRDAIEELREERAELLKRIEALEASAANLVHEEERSNNRHNDQEIAFSVSDLVRRSAEDAADAHTDPKEYEERHDQLKDVEIKNQPKTLQEVIYKDRPVSADQIFHSGILPEGESR